MQPLIPSIGSQSVPSRSKMIKSCTRLPAIWLSEATIRNRDASLPADGTMRLAPLFVPSTRRHAACPSVSTPNPQEVIMADAGTQKQIDTLYQLIEQIETAM